MFENIKEDVGTEGLKKTTNSDILLIDGLNTFIRSFMAVPSMNNDGLHIGGIAGFLKSVGYAIKLINPTRVVVVFDGNGGSQKRRKIYPDYKKGRRTRIKFNRTYEDLSSSDIEEKNLKKELMRLVSYLDVLPVTVMAIDNIEADDTIAYLATNVFRPKGSEVIIMSDDKDFIQLVDEKTSVWRPVEKKYYTPKEVHERFGIPSHNFIHYKVFMGDASDNIKGINGIGIKTMQSKFPVLLEDKHITLDAMLEYCNTRKDEHRIYKTVLENETLS